MTKEKKKKKKVTNVILRLDNKEAILDLSNADAGILMKAIYVYATDQEIPSALHGYLRTIFLVLKADIDSDNEAYREKCEKNRINGTKAAEKKNVLANGTGRSPTVPYTNNNNKVKNNSGEINSPSMNGAESESDDPQYSFEKIWRLYDKPVGNKGNIKAIWLALSLDEKKAIFEYVPLYVKIRPNRQFRKNFEGFLTQRTWENEPIDNLRDNTNGTGHHTSGKPDTARGNIYANAAAAMQQLICS